MLLKFIFLFIIYIKHKDKETTQIMDFLNRL